MTNTVDTLELTAYPDIYFSSMMTEISRAYNIRACTEEIIPLRHGPSFYFENAVLSNVLENVVTGHTNHVWRYENASDSIYIYPETKSISMIRCASVSVTNAPLKALFDENDLLGLKKSGFNCMKIMSDENSLLNETVSLELEEPYVWQVLDAICERLSGFSSWQMQVFYATTGCRYIIYFDKMPSD